MYEINNIIIIIIKYNADQEPLKLKRLEPWNHLTSVRSVWPKPLLRRSHRYRFQNIASGEAWRFPF